MLVQHKEMSTS